MRVRRLLICALLALPAAALAKSPTVQDRDDSKAAVDIATARGSHNRTADLLVHSIGAYDDFAPRDLLNRDGPPGSVCLNIWTTREPGEDPPNYDVCVTSDKRGRVYRASIARLTRNARRVGAARVDQPDPKRLEIRFDPDRIQRPRSYRWVAQAATFGEGCDGPTGCEDFAPDRPDTALTRLGTPRRKRTSRSR
jgi:hypothetical protein